ncbi:unnamed protein product [Gongylonema pulchrum]|uniref:Acyl-CoA_dh_1 domain-containing protein n=1 Tax=Gongylonema pulchrum TaxID=637853 RepID=A0A183EBB4_9BILA|nr:unnamed protein product [Gongylonema pulchrum]
MNILNNGRFGIPAACTGSMVYCIHKTIAHVSERAQFGRKLKEFGNVQEQLIDMVLRHYATESLVYMLSGTMDRGVQDYQLEAAVGKIMASENAWNVCDRAIQLHGGMGYMRECERQWELVRLADAAIDIYSTAAVLSRCSRAAALQQSAFDCERKLAELYTKQACARVNLLMTDILTRTGEVDQIKTISDEIFKAGALTSLHPLDY